MDTATQNINKEVQLKWLDLLVHIIQLVAIVIGQFVLTPTNMGFFCHDESLSYPYVSSTITVAYAAILFIALPIVLILIVVIYQQTKSQSIRVIAKHCTQHINVYMFGLGTTFIITQLGKLTIGRLRPYFFAVCQPQMSDGTTCLDAVNHNRYIEDYKCMGTEHNAAVVAEIGSSFPSAHSSLGFYAMLYMCFFIQYNIKWNKSNIFKHLLQTTLICLAWFTALSRVKDHWHHWSDVLVGIFIGAVVAVGVTIYICKSKIYKYSK